MQIPNLPTRPLIAAALSAAELVLTTGTGRTHASEPANRQDTKNIDGGTAVRFKLSGAVQPQPREQCQAKANRSRPRPAPKRRTGGGNGLVNGSLNTEEPNAFIEE